MRDLTYYIGTSLDGFASGPGGEVDFFPVSDDHIAHMVTEHPEVLPTHVREQLGIDGPNQRFDTIIQGRVTYDAALAVGITSPYAHLREYVASTTLAEDIDPHVTVVTDPVAAIQALKQEDGLGIYLAGGGRLAGALRDEIDHLIVKVYPILAGTGVPMFSAGFRPTSFDLTDHQTFSSGTAVHTYRRI